jgi:ubiquinone/menaquinone biosynthesis C-methylase UbiE
MDKENKADTSWGKVADWYDDLVLSENSYQKTVILPGVLRLLGEIKGEKILDVACGQGFFAAEFSSKDALVSGVDISPELIKKAQSNAPKAKFYVAQSHELLEVVSPSFDKATLILAAQNIEKIDETYKSVWKLLKPKGKFVVVLNHPAFRIPKHSSWIFDEKAGVQSRKIDAYMREIRQEILMHPGDRNSKTTVSFHRPLQYFFKLATNNNFSVLRLEEWISDRESQKGPRKKAEDESRKEFPLFLAMVLEKRD